MKIYISAPYTKPDPMENFFKAIGIADDLMKIGHTPFVPHLYYWWDRFSPKRYNTWLKLCKEWVSSCDAILRMPGKSKGADAEVKLAKELNIPVYYNLKDL